MILFQNITKIFSCPDKRIIALEDVSFDIEKGEFVCIAGKSGAGKTTLIRLLICEDKPTSGQVIFQKVNMTKAGQHLLQRMRRKIGVVHQDYKLFAQKTVEENLIYIMHIIDAPKEQILKDIPQVLEIVGLEHRINHFPHELSGGEKQRLSIARALIHRPEVIVADEPTGNLDLYNTYEVISLLQKINNLGATVLLATHNKEIIDGLKKRVITLEQGRIISDEKRGKFIL